MSQYYIQRNVGTCFDRPYTDAIKTYGDTTIRDAITTYGNTTIRDASTNPKIVKVITEACENMPDFIKRAILCLMQEYDLHH